MVRAYLRYVESASFGVVYSPGVDVQLDNSSNLIVCGALDSVQVWNAKQGELVKQFRPPEQKTASGARTKEPPAVTKLVPIPNGAKFAAGYSDGSIRVWNLDSSECEMTLNGHSKAISSLRCSVDGCCLVSGSRDTDIIVWDLVAQTGLFRLRSHVDAVNDLCFLPNNLLASASKDTLVKGDFCHESFLAITLIFSV
jgi:U3 small nucleolar RNA-associated protein 12